MSWMYYSKGRIRDRIIEHNSDISGELGQSIIGTVRSFSNAGGSWRVLVSDLGNAIFLLQATAKEGDQERTTLIVSYRIG